MRPHAWGLVICLSPFLENLAMGMNKWAGLSLACGVCIIVGLAASSGRSQPSITPSGGGAHPVATLDIVRIFSDTAQIKDLNDYMRQKTEDYTAELKQRSEALNARKLEMQAFKAGSADYEKRRKDLVKLNAEAIGWSKATEDDLDQQKFDWTVEIYKQAIDAAVVVAKTRGFDIVIQKTDFKPGEITDRSVQALRSMIQSRTVIHSIPEIDITEDVIRTMDQTYKSKPNARPAAPATPQPPPITPPNNP